jgi:hypothetical protein
MLASLVFALLAPLAVPAEALPSKFSVNPQAVEEVAAGARTVASAAWWGFNTEDATETLQAAINSKAKTLVVPNMGAPWIVRPLELRGDLELVFDPGVLVLAKKGEFRGPGDSLFRAQGADNLSIRGYGATLRMHKRDYQNHPYEKAEWRMGIAIRGCRNVLIEGVRIESTGGDGIYIDGGGERRWSEDITVRNCISHDNHRQGISVISAQDLLIENCILSGTRGTAPEAGIDFEPDNPDQRLVNCVVRNCVMESNNGHAILVYLNPLSSESEPVSITFENCVARMGEAGDHPAVARVKAPGGWAGMAVGASRDAGPQGLVEFRNCVAENTGREGAKVFDKSARGVKVRFVNCVWKAPWLADAVEYDGPRVPVLVHLRRPEMTEQPGGVEFIDCHVYDAEARPALVAHEDKSSFGVRDLSGGISVHNPHGARMDLGSNASGIAADLVVPAP